MLLISFIKQVFRIIAQPFGRRHAIRPASTNLLNDRLPNRDRFGKRLEHGGLTVFDIFTGIAVEVDGVPQVALPRKDADDLCETLNLHDQWRRAKLRI